MSHSHHHGHHHNHEHRAHGHRALAADPTFSLLRLSAWQRLAGAAVLLSALWFIVLKVMG